MSRVSSNAALAGSNGAVVKPYGGPEPRFFTVGEVEDQLALPGSKATKGKVVFAFPRVLGTGAKGKQCAGFEVENEGKREIYFTGLHVGMLESKDFLRLLAQSIADAKKDGKNVFIDCGEIKNEHKSLLESLCKTRDIDTFLRPIRGDVSSFRLAHRIFHGELRSKLHTTSYLSATYEFIPNVKVHSNSSHLVLEVINKVDNSAPVAFKPSAEWSPGNMTSGGLLESEPKLQFTNNEDADIVDIGFDEDSILNLRISRTVNPYGPPIVNIGRFKKNDEEHIICNWNTSANLHLAGKITSDEFTGNVLSVISGLNQNDKVLFFNRREIFDELEHTFTFAKNNEGTFTFTLNGVDKVYDEHLPLLLTKALSQDHNLELTIEDESGSDFSIAIPDEVEKLLSDIGTRLYEMGFNVDLERKEEVPNLFSSERMKASITYTFTVKNRQRA